MYKLFVQHIHYVYTVIFRHVSYASEILTLLLCGAKLLLDLCNKNKVQDGLHTFKLYSVIEWMTDPVFRCKVY